MEIYLFAGLVFIYFITVTVLKENVLQKLWLAAFMITFALCAMALSFLRISHQDVMMSAIELSWYYILYLSASVMVVLGAINLWLFRRSLYKILFDKEADENDEDFS